MDLNNKLKIEDYNIEKDKQSYILDVLVSENCLGRWLWKSGEVKSSFAIPWEVQVANTNTSNYLWEKDKSSLMVVQAGI